MTRPLRAVVVAGTLGVVLMIARPAQAHDGPPFPLASDEVVGPYRVSIWTDPDTTDGGVAGGRFWVTLRPARDGVPLPVDTRADVSITPLDPPGAASTARTELLDGEITRQFAALVMDREGRFGVRVVITGPLGPAAIDAEVEATYDLRPPPALIAVYLMPFLLIGFLWVKLMLRRRRRNAV